MKHLYRKLNIRTHAFMRVIIPILSVMVLAQTLIPGQAQAWSASDPLTSPPQCANPPSALNGWDYKQKIRDVWPAWNPETVQKALLIWEVWDGSTGNTVTNFAYGDEIRFKLLNDGTMGVTRTIGSTSQPNWPFRDFSGTSNDSTYFMNIWFTADPTTGGAFYHNLGNFNGTPVSSMTDNPLITGVASTTPSGGSLKCISAGVNVTYDKNYNGRHYDVSAPNSGVGDGTGTINCESPWYKFWEQPVCKFNTAINSVGNALTQAAKDVANGLVTALAWLFVPDGDKLNLQYNTELDYWQDKWGFLSFPIVALSDLFDALQDPDNFLGCTTTSCTRNFGNMFGSPVSINFSAMNNLSPSLWNFLLIVLRIGAIYAMIVTLKWQYWRIIHRKDMN